MSTDKRKNNKKRSESHSHSHRGSQFSRSQPELEEFFESVHERMKDLAIAQKSYKSRNDKELSVKPGEFFEVLDDVGSWWCLRAPSGRTGHVPKTHLEIIPNPAKAAAGYNDQTWDPIVVKVPVVVKASVHHQEVEEKMKSSTAKKRQATPPPTARTPSPSPPSPPPPAQSQPETPPKNPAPAPAPAAPSERKGGTASDYPPPPPQSIFPPVNYNDRRPTQTIIREVIREVSPHREYRRAKSKYQAKRDASPQYSEGSGSSCSTKTSSSSGVSSWISDGPEDRMPARREKSPQNHRSKSQQRTRRPSHRSVSRQQKREPQPSAHQPGHCCHAAGRDSTCRYRSICCYSPKCGRARSTITDVSQRESGRKSKQQEQSPQQPQQPMIILLEPPKQETVSQPQVLEEQVADDCYDPNNQPQISIVLPPNAQLGSTITPYTPLQPTLQPQSQYTQYYNWTPQYYQGYA
ncbi:hypothetical protein Aperf_G00000101514 [Anoplocephala perfoliata]